ncbi:MAG: hypothetical protein JXQ90_02040 [Cyclobacteriaceae bacterium]
MKLRIKQKSLALRLEGTELETLMEQGEVIQKLWLGPAPTSIRLSLANGPINVTHRDGNFNFQISKENVETLIDTSKIGFLEEKESFSLIIEKDIPKKRKD